jgi:hypothetical protein
MVVKWVTYQTLVQPKDSHFETWDALMSSGKCCYLVLWICTNFAKESATSTIRAEERSEWWIYQMLPWILGNTFLYNFGTYLMDYSTTSHKPVIFIPNYIQHIHMMANQTLEWHVLYFLHVMDVHIRIPKQTATDYCCINTVSPVTKNIYPYSSKRKYVYLAQLYLRLWPTKYRIFR